MGVRFLHTADIHLGSPLDGLGAQNADLQQDLRKATYAAFRRLIDVAIDDEVDFVVVAGDLYDRESRSVRANQFAAEQFARLDDAGIPVYLVYGNHDPVESGIEYVDLPDNVHEFSADSAGSVVFDDGERRACLCGQSYRRKAESRTFHADYDPVESDLPTIGLLHTGLDPDNERYVPCDVSDLCGRDAIDYWALGHVHAPNVEHREPTIAYPGIPQGRHINESGLRGAYLIDLESDGRADLEFVPTGQIVWREETVSVGADDDPEADPPDGVPALRERIEERLVAVEPDISSLELDVAVRDADWSPTGVMCRWILTGRGPGHELLTEDEETIDLLQSELRSQYDRHSPYVWTEEIRHRTGPPLPPMEEFDDDPVFEQLDETVDEIRSNPETRENLLEERMGSVCVLDEGDETERPAYLEITEADTDRMIDRAAELVLDELRARRVE